MTMDFILLRWENKFEGIKKLNESLKKKYNKNYFLFNIILD